MNPSHPIGTLAWARRSGGYLSTGDHLRLAVQDLLDHCRRLTGRRRTPSVAASAATQAPPLPTGNAAQRTLEFATLASPRWLLRHGLRTYLWASLLGQARGLAWDDEILFVASLLHDLALGEGSRPLCSQRPCLAVESAEAAGRFARRLGWDDARRQRLQEAISLHLNPRVPLALGAEAHLLHAGVALDCTGCGLAEIPATAAADVLARYPRDDFKSRMTTALGLQSHRRFGTRAARLARQGLDRLILAAPFPE